MKAVVIEKPSSFQIRELPDPHPGEGEVGLQDLLVRLQTEEREERLHDGGGTDPESAGQLVEGDGRLHHVQAPGREVVVKGKGEEARLIPLPFGDHPCFDAGAARRKQGGDPPEAADDPAAVAFAP